MIQLRLEGIVLFAEVAMRKNEFTKLVQAELETLHVVPTVLPRMTSFIVSAMPELPRGPRTDF